MRRVGGIGSGSGSLKEHERFSRRLPVQVMRLERKTLLLRRGQALSAAKIRVVVHEGQYMATMPFGQLLGP